MTPNYENETDFMKLYSFIPIFFLFTPNRAFEYIWQGNVMKLLRKQTVLYGLMRLLAR